MVEQLQGLIGETGTLAVQGLLQSASRPAEGALGTLVGLLVLVVGATSVFAELKDDLNRIWKVPARRNDSGVLAWLRTRILSIGLILAIGFLMLVSLAASAVFQAAGSRAGLAAGVDQSLGEAINSAVSYLLIAALLALIYRFMPDARVRWRDVVFGALVTALLFVAGKYLIGLYIARSALASSFGAAGSFAVLLAWVYYSAQIFLFGAEFTWAHADDTSAAPPARA